MLTAGLIFSLSFSCIQDRIFPYEEVQNPKAEIGEYGINSILINEFVSSACKSSEVNNGSCHSIISAFYTPTESRNGKWIELYNPADTAINLGSGQWFLTDDTVQKDLFRLPKGTLIQAKDMLIICCDDFPQQPGDQLIHAPFSLGRYSGDIGLYYKSWTGTDSIMVLVNHIHYVAGASKVPSYDSTARHISYGRYPDGNGGNFLRLGKATPGKSNQM